jgi:ATP-dependent RNA helicase RhlE
MVQFKDFGLHPSIVEALTKKGYTTPNPIQEQSIPQLLQGKDLLGIAQTGTGKTAAFSLPIINRLASSSTKTNSRCVKVLILTPTRELASQIDMNIRGYSKGMNIRSAVVFGGVGYQPQIQALFKGLEILVATPGRLMDLINERHIDFSQLEVFVLDEADRMLDMGFINDVKKIIAKLPTNKQTLLFSATMPKDIAQLANSLLKTPVRVEVTPESTTVERIEQKVYMVTKVNKTILLEHVLKTQAHIKSVLVFTRTKHGADRIMRHLQFHNISCAAIHGNKSQGAREEALNNFRNGKIRVLIATDIAARGIDIPHVSHVLNFNVPEDGKNYVQRIGRTARAGRDGAAISFCDETEGDMLRGVEKLIKQKLEIDTNHPYHGIKLPVPVSKPRGPKAPRTTKSNSVNPTRPGTRAVEKSGKVARKFQSRKPN